MFFHLHYVGFGSPQVAYNFKSRAAAAARARWLKRFGCSGFQIRVTDSML